MDFEFVIDDHTTYYLMSDFKSAKAKTLFRRYQQMEKDYYQQEEKLNGLRQQYAGANQQGKAKWLLPFSTSKSGYCKCPKNSMLSK